MTLITVDLAAQTLVWQDENGERRTYPVSTAKNGAGERFGSGQTPRGRHRIRAKIGAGLPVGAVLVGRRWHGEIYSPKLAAAAPERDWILSRILWLSGLESGVNRGMNRCGVCDTFRRLIYIHGTPDSEPMGIPLSHGCIRMRNTAVIDLFERVDSTTEVVIHD